jgi:hypothetical protein
VRERTRHRVAAKFDRVMTPRGDSKRRKQLAVSDVESAERVLHLAWLSLPPAHRALLQSIGASNGRPSTSDLAYRSMAFCDLPGIERSRAQPILGWTMPSPFGSRICVLSS